MSLWLIKIENTCLLISRNSVKHYFATSQVRRFANELDNFHHPFHLAKIVALRSTASFLHNFLSSAFGIWSLWNSHHSKVWNMFGIKS